MSHVFLNVTPNHAVNYCKQLDSDLPSIWSNSMYIFDKVYVKRAYKMIVFISRIINAKINRLKFTTKFPNVIINKGYLYSETPPNDYPSTKTTPQLRPLVFETKYIWFNGH